MDHASVGDGPAAGAGGGNSVVVDHADGWQTQYSHMRKGSVRVKRNDRLKIVKMDAVKKEVASTVATKEAP